MPERAEIRDVILGVAEAATGGVVTLRDARLPAHLEDFDVEVRYDGTGLPSECSVSIRFTIITSEIVGGRS